MPHFLDLRLCHTLQMETHNPDHKTANARHKQRERSNDRGYVCPAHYPIISLSDRDHGDHNSANADKRADNSSDDPSCTTGPFLDPDDPALHPLPP